MAATVVAINFSPVQNFLLNKTTKYLSEKLNTQVTADKIRIHFLNSVELNGVTILDQQKDTLIHAGSIGGKITDWFFLKDKSTIEFLELQDAIVQIKRNDYHLPWNYQFIIDAFVNPKKTKKNKEFPSIDLKKIELSNVKFLKQDDTLGDVMVMDFGSLTVLADNVDIPNKKIHISSIDIDEFTFEVNKFIRNNVTPIRRWTQAQINQKTPFNPQDFDIQLGEINITNSKFITSNINIPILQNQFDGRHINLKDINIDAQKIVIVKDTIYGYLNHLSAVDRSGFAVKKLSGDVKVNPNISEVRNMYLETNSSILRNYYAMEYRHFPAFLNYLEEVEMVVDLKNSNISMRDIAYFAPELLRWDGKEYTGGFQGRGTIKDLDIFNIDLADEQLRFTGNYRMTGLPDINSTTIQYTDGNIYTSYEALIDLFPEIAKLDIEQFKQLENIHFAGEVNGIYNDLVINGDFHTNIGLISSDALKLKYSGPDFLYEGNLKSEMLNVAQLFSKENLGDIAFDFFLKGDGFNYKEDNITLTGQVPFMDFNDYRYQRINLDMLTYDGKLKADIKSTDSNFNLDLVTHISNFDQIPNYDINGQIYWIDFQKLNLIENSFSGKGIVDANITFSNLKNIEGEAKLKDITLLSGPDTISYYDFYFSSYREGVNNNVTFKTHNLNVNVDGAFYLDDLVNSSQRFFNHYMSGFIPPLDKNVPMQSFTFHIEADQPDELLSVFVPRLKLSNGVELSGRMDENYHNIEIVGDIPYIRYNNLVAHDIKFKSQGDLSSMTVDLTTSKFLSNDKQMIEDMEFKGRVANNLILFDVNTKSSNAFGTANITGQALTQNDSFILMIEPSELFFNNQKWDIKSGNKVVFSHGLMDIDNFILNSEKQTIAINTPDMANKQPRVANMNIQNVNVKPVLQIIGMDDLALTGNLDGNIIMKNLPKRLQMDFNVLGNNLFTNQQPLGELKLIGNYDIDQKKLILENPSGMYDQNGYISLKGTLITDSLKKNIVDFKAEGHNGSLTWAEPFASDLLKDLSGELNGYIHINGRFPSPNIDGIAEIKEAKFTPLITGVEYQLPNTKIEITSDIFRINECDILDDEGNKGIISGTINHSYFADLDFALRMIADNIKVLDKSKEEAFNSNFYGKVYAGVNLTLRGLLRDLNMNITARTGPNSKLYIPIAGNSDLEQYEYITFKKDIQDTASERILEKKTRLTVNLDAIANPNLEAEIIIDPKAGDIINARGSGNLSMHIPSEGDIRLNGSYNIESGYYDFTFNSLQLLVYKNRFNLLAGSVINWDGKISEANVDVKANTIKRARLYDLIVDDVMRGSVTLDNSSSERSDALTPQNVVIDMNMTGKLLSPDLKFKLDLEETRSVGTYAYQKLQRINQDDRDLVNQVIALLVLNQFMPMEGVNSNVAVNTGVSNIADIFSTFASSQITNFTNRMLGVEDLWVNLKYKSYNISDEVVSGNNLNYLNRNEAGVSVRKNFMNNRIVVDVGGVYDWGRGSYASGSSITDNLAGDFRLAYLLTPDGRLRMNIFRTSSFDAISLQNVGRHGIGFAYRKNFSNFKDLFGLQKKIFTLPNVENDVKIDSIDSTSIQKPVDTAMAL